ncbi:PREDICTED: uncharacterized protein LOC104823082 [Tarenaya hassleriana]|uniref:uncharacterized protein LOC104823082 n=1 Tax=Tarenaya hassleriana TaxID=28532 RepID=UPI00053C1294|nr:PREDICTED: uncharacterized protein LOC104823082 [Tarenaya hassleriana]
MSGISLCNSISIRSCSSHPLSCSQKLRFFASVCSATSTCTSLVPRSRQTLLKAQALVEKRDDGFRSFVVKNRRDGRGGLMESNGFGEVVEGGEDEEEDEDWDSYDVAGDGEDDEGVLLPLEKMKKWLESKPRGFGEGKVYDTSVEDKLLDEIEQSWKAQAANINKLKNEPIKAQPKRGNKNTKEGDEDVETGIRVCVSNLPKKKNVHKDLKSAFKGVSGILDIIPSVSGNKKTRDPVCKGFAFVDFRTDTDAVRFVDLFSGQRILFGKVQKQIKCTVLNSSSSTSGSDQESSEDEQELPDTDLEEAVSNSDFVVEDAFLDTTQVESDESGYSTRDLEDTKTEDARQNLVYSSRATPKEPRHDPEIHLKSPEQTDEIPARENGIMNMMTSSKISFQTVAEAKLDDQLDVEDMEENPEAAGQPKSLPDSSSEEGLTRIRQLERKLLSKGKLWNGADSDETEEHKQDKDGKKKRAKKKVLAKGQAKKVKKLEIPGSSKRLRVKEKAVLTGVLSKYAAKASTSNGE